MKTKESTAFSFSTGSNALGKSMMMQKAANASLRLNGHVELARSYLHGRFLSPQYKTRSQSAKTPRMCQLQPSQIFCLESTKEHQ
ncbi:hypothetical protein L914_13043 [Phytophthora nicotianae]|uniref:Uncharacterized protein n=1 Tax=Phytophthora nicotianae TaxID=4792 RepID=W2MZT5_PHYNI|nr:hypothetical protein L914_13043 [Phytophthora nicotianae]